MTQNTTVPVNLPSFFNSLQMKLRSSSLTALFNALYWHITWLFQHCKKHESNCSGLHALRTTVKWQQVAKRLFPWLETSICRVHYNMWILWIL